ncbi:NAD(P)-dependent oxidoreductase [Nocardia sp. NPDC051981]|uniref:NAD(P)-dependent oxidoreductase n=1 Tax=Nocardia sp. NPDC051981 TaxID=3155417 RepID=UPI00344AACFA
MSMFDVGLIGTGAMGTQIATRIIAAGHRLAVHNRTRANALAVENAGGQWCGSARELAGASRIVISCLRNTFAVEAVYGGSDGLLCGARPGQIFVEHGTFAPATARDLAALAREQGAAFLDAPVTGGPAGAAQGTLTIMAGGDADAIDQVTPLLKSFGSRVIRIGGSGAGLELKLVNQLLVGAHMTAAAEAIRVLDRVGLDLGLAAEVLLSGWAESTMLRRAFTQLALGAVEHTGATISGMSEVLDLVNRLRDDARLSGPVLDATTASFRAAVACGAGELDPAALARPDQRNPAAQVGPR